MYRMVDIDELEQGDKVVIIFDEKPLIVTVDEISLENGDFTIVEGGYDIHLDQICVIDKDQLS